MRVQDGTTEQGNSETLTPTLVLSWYTIILVHTHIYIYIYICA